MPPSEPAAQIHMTPRNLLSHSGLPIVIKTDKQMRDLGKIVETVNVQKSIVFLYSNNEHLLKKNWKKILKYPLQ